MCSNHWFSYCTENCREQCILENIVTALEVIVVVLEDIVTVLQVSVTVYQGIIEGGKDKREKKTDVLKKLPRGRKTMVTM